MSERNTYIAKWIVEVIVEPTRRRANKERDSHLSCAMLEDAQRARTIVSMLRGDNTKSALKYLSSLPYPLKEQIQEVWVEAGQDFEETGGKPKPRSEFRNIDQDGDGFILEFQNGGGPISFHISDYCAEVIACYVEASRIGTTYGPSPELRGLTSKVGAP